MKNIIYTFCLKIFNDKKKLIRLAYDRVLWKKLGKISIYKTEYETNVIFTNSN